MGAILGRCPLLLGEVSPQSQDGGKRIMTGFAPSNLSARDSAIEKLEAFLPHAGSYHSQRNFVVPGHGNVSQLSPALRVRLLTECEVLERLWREYEPGEAETFEKEVWWRVYWKGWLEKRPGIWRQYRSKLAELDWSDRALEIVGGNSGVEIMDHFTRELISTGYLHNHARMWWAAWWIHVERLPWQLGADFFLRHLLDGDAASNTLSWRWVAGLHTRGKEYLPRRSNLEMFIAAEILETRGAGLKVLENPVPAGLPFSEPPEPLELFLEDVDELDSIFRDSRVGIWIHDEDLHLESSPILQAQPQSLRAFVLAEEWKFEKYSESKRAFLKTALQDGGARAAAHYDCSFEMLPADDLAVQMANWAREDSLDAIISMRPFTGLLQDRIGEITSRLEEEGVSLHQFSRPEDRIPMNRATAGFFSFWKKTGGFRAELHRERNDNPATS